MNPSARSPRLSQQAQLQRPVSRPFDVYGTLPTQAAMYGLEDGGPFGRFDAARNQFGPMNGSLFPSYDMAASQTWNPSATALPNMAGNQAGLMGQTGSLLGPSRLKASRGRGGLAANVSSLDPGF